MPCRSCRRRRTRSSASIALLQAEDPDADDGGWVDLDLRRVAQRLRNDEAEANPLAVRALVKGLSQDGKGLAAGLGSLELQHLGRDRYQVRLQRSWGAIKKTAPLRRDVAYVILKPSSPRPKGPRERPGRRPPATSLSRFRATSFREP